VSAVVLLPDPPGRPLPLLHAASPRVVAHVDGRAVDCGAFLAEVQATAAALPAARHALNLCEDRYRFLVGFCAAALRGQTSLLPHSRAPDVVADVLQRYPDSISLIDHDDGPAPPAKHRLHAFGALPPVEGVPDIDAAHCVAIGFTSGSSGPPKPNPKRWGSFHDSSARNVGLLRTLCDAVAPGKTGHVVATVPPQHMYGMELTVLLPLLGDFAVHAGRPFFPADVAEALASVPAPRLLVTTPVHLRALLRSGQALPALAGIVSATAPLPAELAADAEQAFAAPVQELFGSTETCVIAHRRTATTTVWQHWPEITLRPCPDGTEVDAPWFDTPTLLQDIVDLQPPDGFVLCGRNTDLLEIAGKRASLGELTARLLALPGVEDAVVFQSEPSAGGVQRIAALVVAPSRSETELLAALRSAVDPVFLPRPLRRVDRLPRNETGKLPRALLLELLGRG